MSYVLHFVILNAAKHFIILRTVKHYVILNADKHFVILSEAKNLDSSVAGLPQNDKNVIIIVILNGA